MRKSSFCLLCLVVTLATFAQAGMPPEQWLKMRQSGFSTDALSEYMQMKGKTVSSLFPMPNQKATINKAEYEQLARTPLVGRIHVIGNGKWFYVDWPHGGYIPKRVVVIGPDRLIVSEAILKKQKKRKEAIRARYRVPDEFINLKRFIPTFAVSIEKLASLTYHPTFNKKGEDEEFQKRLAQVEIDPRIGRVEAIGENLSARWERDSFAPKEYTTVAIFNKNLDFCWGAFRGKSAGKGRFLLLPSFGSVLVPSPGDFVVPLELAQNVASGRGEIVFNKVKPPLTFCNIFGQGRMTKVFPRWFFPGLYQFGVTAGKAHTSNVVPLCYVLVRAGVAIGVDWLELELLKTKGKARQLHVKQLLYHHYRPR